MADDDEPADRPAKIALSAPELLVKGYRDYWRYHVTIADPDGQPVEQQRDVIRAGKVAAVLPLDLARDELVLIRQFRLPAHLANGRGDLVETVAGRVEPNETPIETARRECKEEIGVGPSALVELFSYLTTPGITDEEVTVFLAAVDAARSLAHPASPDGELIRTLRLSVDDALAALAEGDLHNGPLLIALQWLALNRGRVATLLGGSSR